MEDKRDGQILAEGFVRAIPFSIKFLISAVGSLCIVALVTFPALADSPKEAFTKDLVKLSGLEQQLRQVPLLAVAGLAEQQGKLPPELYNSLQRIVRDAFNAERMQRNVTKRIERNLDTGIMRKTLNWLQSDLGKKVTRLEEAASTPQAFKEIRALAKQLEITPPPQHRIELAQRLDSATSSTEFMVNILESTAMALVKALDAAQPTEQQVGEYELRREIGTRRPKMWETYRQVSTVSLLYTYKTLSDAELERYLDFLESKVGGDYQYVVSVAMREALLDASDDMTKAIVQVMTKINRKSAHAVP